MHSFWFDIAIEISQITVIHYWDHIPQAIENGLKSVVSLNKIASLATTFKTVTTYRPPRL